MKIIVCTRKTQGKRKSDFCWTTEGEVAYLGFECDTDRNAGPDGGCGCRRSFSGMATGKATTTAEVVESPMSEKEFVEAYLDRMERAGWTTSLTSNKEVAEFVKGAKEMLTIANGFPVGAILEKRGNRIQAR
jgi:hypothetical protein